MNPSIAALDRVVAKYRSDVHQLAPAASNDALLALEEHLGQRLPQGLRSFLHLHNGAALFRGALSVRSASEIVVASDAAPSVVLFADGSDNTTWAFSADPTCGFVFGRWNDEVLEPMHTSFMGWMNGTISVIETRVVHPDDQAELRLEADPQDPIQLETAGARALRKGDPDEASLLLREATTARPEALRAWQYLGDALAIHDRGAARKAWLTAFRLSRFPLAWPGAACIEPDLLRSLEGAFPDAEGWEQELHKFLDERVLDARCEEAVQVIVAAGRGLARSLVKRGKRREARDVLADLVSRVHGFVANHQPWEALLELARVEGQLGHHDEAEALLRRVRNAPEEIQARGLLELAAVATTRQEPWAEEISDEAGAAGLSAPDQLQLALLRFERAVRLQRPDAHEHLVGLATSARKLGSPRLEAAVALAEGDAARIGGRLDEAGQSYQQALHRLGHRDPELRFRVVLRQSDLAAMQRDANTAGKLCGAAARGFAEHELPIREGWALLRLARYVERSVAGAMLQRARERFVAADLASGVAAVDSMLGDPGASLLWHLDRSAVQARARHDAQRSRLPWSREDADRPERRLGAHRMAIAACSESVVGSIEREMEACARAFAVGRGRATDPPVLRYVAAVDLLAGHRSYGAATVLLSHLLRGSITGGPFRALQGAIARSPNAALVDGLLRCVERPEQHPSTSVAAAAEVLGLRREPAAVKVLCKLISKPGSPKVRHAAVTALGRIGNRSTVDKVAATLEDPALAEAAALSLLMLGDRRGIDFHGRALLERRNDLSGHPGEIVGRYGGPDHLLLLTGAARGEGDCAIGALQGLGLMGDPRGVPTLLEALHSRERRMVQVASGALSILSGREDDPDEPGVRSRWHAWWESEQSGYPAGVRHRDGVVFDNGVLIRKMEHADAWVRRTSYDELVIATGETLPFDADGPWRVQVSHLRAWRRWWGSARQGQVPGRWMLDGRVIH